MNVVYRKDVRHDYDSEDEWGGSKGYDDRCKDRRGSGSRRQTRRNMRKQDDNLFRVDDE